MISTARNCLSFDSQREHRRSVRVNDALKSERARHSARKATLARRAVPVVVLVHVPHGRPRVAQIVVAPLLGGARATPRARAHAAVARARGSHR